jgi:peptide deformylase
MILEIKKYPDSVLKKRCREIKEITPEIKEMAFDLSETMMKKDGIGLAAPQIGRLEKIIAINIGDDPQVFINPIIISKGREKEYIEEGCLSFPGLFLNVKRPKEVEVEAFNLEGKKMKIKAEGLAARVFQHEIDHLNGILFINRIPFWQRLKLKLDRRNDNRKIG